MKSVGVFFHKALRVITAVINSRPSTSLNFHEKVYALKCLKPSDRRSVYQQSQFSFIKPPQFELKWDSSRYNSNPKCPWTLGFFFLLLCFDPEFNLQKSKKILRQKHQRKLKKCSSSARLVGCCITDCFQQRKMREKLSQCKRKCFHPHSSCRRCASLLFFHLWAWLFRFSLSSSQFSFRSLALLINKTPQTTPSPLLTAIWCLA